MAKKIIKGIVKKKNNGDSIIFALERRGSYTLPGRLIDEENDPDFAARKRALNTAYKSFGIKINELGDVYKSHNIAIPGNPQVEEIYQEVSDWERITPSKTSKSVRFGRVRWAPAEQIYSILDDMD
jgi:hypothetical protein